MGKKRRAKRGANEGRPSGEATPDGAAPEPAEPTPVPADSEASGPAEPAAAAIDRRSLLLTGGRVAVGGCGLLLAAGALRTALPEFGGEGPRRFSLGALADFHRGSLTFLREARLFVLHDAGGLGAFSSRCTHLGCGLRRTTEGFACPCHGARFDGRGAVLSGPPRRPLPWFALAVDEAGALWVDLGERVPAATATPRPLESGEGTG